MLMVTSIMSQKSKLIKSRKKWKEKATERASEKCYLRKENARIKKKLKEVKNECKKAKIALDKEKKTELQLK